MTSRRFGGADGNVSFAAEHRFDASSSEMSPTGVEVE
jgi:hypothetical protein